MNKFSKGIRYLVIFLFSVVFVLTNSINFVYGSSKEKITLQLRWDHQFQFAGYYAAKWLGYYEEEGLDVEIVPAFTKDRRIRYATQEVAEGRAHFGIGSVDTIIARNYGHEFTIVASIFQRSPVEFFMLEETPFSSLVDLVHLNTARRKNDLLDIELQAMLISEGINPQQLPLHDEALDFTIEDLIENRFDVLPGYLGTLSFYGDKAGIALKVIRPLDYGIDFYGDSLFTRKSLVEVRPEMVERFKRASLKGWKYALENPDEIIMRIVTEFGDASGRGLEEFLKYNEFQANRVKGYTLYPIVEIGNINPYRWSSMKEVLVKLNLLEEGLNWDGFIFDYQEILNLRREKIDMSLTLISIALLVFFLILLIVHLTTQNNMKKLKGMVQQELVENQKKEALIIYQARLAAMGEMIANIAHQWRQPLNNLGLLLSNIEDAYTYNELDANYLNTSIIKSRKLINKMSDTIDDFRYFLNPQVSIQPFEVYENVMTVLDIMEENLRFNNIDIIFKETTTDKVLGYGNQFSQAIFNIINNSIDALINRGIREKKIWITIYSNDDAITIDIEDNGGGVQPSIGDKIFESYFTTKDEAKGTGLGLYITKMIIENNLKGKINWINTEEGLLMRIVLPKHRGNGDGSEGHQQLP